MYNCTISSKRETPHIDAHARFPCASMIEIDDGMIYQHATCIDQRWQPSFVAYQRCAKICAFLFHPSTCFLSPRRCRRSSPGTGMSNFSIFTPMIVWLDHPTCSGQVARHDQREGKSERKTTQYATNPTRADLNPACRYMLQYPLHATIKDWKERANFGGRFVRRTREEKTQFILLHGKPHTPLTSPYVRCSSVHRAICTF